MERNLYPERLNGRARTREPRRISSISGWEDSDLFNPPPSLLKFPLPDALYLSLIIAGCRAHPHACSFAWECETHEDIL